MNRISESMILGGFVAVCYVGLNFSNPEMVDVSSPYQAEMEEIIDRVNSTSIFSSEDRMRFDFLSKEHKEFVANELEIVTKRREGNLAHRLRSLMFTGFAMGFFAGAMFYWFRKKVLKKGDS